MGDRDSAVENAAPASAYCSPMNDTPTAKRLVQTAIEIDERWIHPRRHLVVKTATKAGGTSVAAGGKVLNHASKRLVVKTATKAGGREPNHVSKRMVVKTAIKAGVWHNHASKRLVVKTSVAAGGKWLPNHASKRLVVKSTVKAGTRAEASMNHAGRRLAVKSAVKAGALVSNHAARRLRVA